MCDTLFDDISQNPHSFSSLFKFLQLFSWFVNPLWIHPKQSKANSRFWVPRGEPGGGAASRSRRRWPSSSGVGAWAQPAPRWWCWGRAASSSAAPCSPGARTRPPPAAAALTRHPALGRRSVRPPFASPRAPLAPPRRRSSFHKPEIKIDKFTLEKCVTFTPNFY